MTDQSQSIKQEIWDEELKHFYDKIFEDVDLMLCTSINTAWDGEQFAKSLVDVILKDLRLLQEFSNSQVLSIPSSEGGIVPTQDWLIVELKPHLDHTKQLIDAYNKVAADVASYLSSHPGYIRFIEAFTLDLVPNMLNELTALLFGADGNTFRTSEEKETKQLEERIKETRENICNSVELLRNNARDIITKKRPITHLYALVESNMPIRPTDSVLRRHYDTMIENEVKKHL